MCVCEGAFTQQQGQNGARTKPAARAHVHRGFLPRELGGTASLAGRAQPRRGGRGWVVGSARLL